jgi:hypothetical protein
VRTGVGARLPDKELGWLLLKKPVGRAYALNENNDAAMQKPSVEAIFDIYIPLLDVLTCGTATSADVATMAPSVGELALRFFEGASIFIRARHDAQIAEAAAPAFSSTSRRSWTKFSSR